MVLSVRFKEAIKTALAMVIAIGIALAMDWACLIPGIFAVEYVEGQHGQREHLYWQPAVALVLARLYRDLIEYPAIAIAAAAFGTVSDSDSGAVFGLGMGGLIPLWGALIGAGFLATGAAATDEIVGGGRPALRPAPPRDDPRHGRDRHRAREPRLRSRARPRADLRGALDTR